MSFLLHTSLSVFFMSESSLMRRLSPIPLPSGAGLGDRDAAMRVAGMHPRYARPTIADAAQSTPKHATHARTPATGSRPHAHSSTSSTLGPEDLPPGMHCPWRTRDTISVDLMPVSHPWGLATMTVTLLLAHVPLIVMQQ